MNQETIENHIKNLSKTDFDNVMTLLLNKIFNLNAIDVDGKGDGGSDYRAFTDLGGNLTISIQKTIQEQNWESKALDDARKAKVSQSAKRFFFLTSKARESSTLRGLENKISSELGISATCLGATEIAGFIVERKLLGEFAYAIDLPLDVDLAHRPDHREMLLHSYFALGDDRHDLRAQMYESSLLSQLYEKSSPVTREALLEGTMNFLGLQESRRQSLSGRIDALLSGGKIIKKQDGLYLDSLTRQNLNIANGIYIKELRQLSAAQIDLITEYGGNWDQEKSEEAALLLAQCFIETQIKTAKHASLSFTMVGFGSYIDSPIERLKDLIRESNVTQSNIDAVFSKMIDLARETPLVKKLTNSVAFVALESSNSSKTSVILGSSSWKDVKIILDASVAIPYLISSLFAPSTGRFSRGSNDTVNLFKQEGACLSMPWFYLNECASHLVNALEYCRNLDEFEDSFTYSQNGYVAHYYQLKHSYAKVPDTLKEYIGSVSNSATKNFSDKNDKIRKVMQELQPLFADYGVTFEDIPKLAGSYLKEIQIEYMYALERLSRKKTQNLINHDVNVLAHMLRNYTERSDMYICLTWDGVMIDIGGKFPNLGWVVSPAEAADLVQSKLKLSKGKLLSLAHTIARTMEAPAELGARIIDRAVQLSGERLADWEYKARIKGYRDQAVARINPNAANFNLDMFDQETDNFLRDQGVAIPENDFNSSVTDLANPSAI